MRKGQIYRFRRFAPRFGFLFTLAAKGFLPLVWRVIFTDRYPFGRQSGNFDSGNITFSGGPESYPIQQGS